jgi:hypothetical protein
MTPVLTLLRVEASKLKSIFSSVTPMVRSLIDVIHKQDASRLLDLPFCSPSLLCSPFSKAEIERAAFREDCCRYVTIARAFQLPSILSESSRL